MSPLYPPSGNSVGGAGTCCEVLMADGVTFPPEPLETEAGDDWLYSD